jgi:hypothetical protein
MESVMTKLLPLVMIATMLPGCFTVGGAVIGSQVSRAEQREHSAKVRRGEAVGPHDDNAVVAGIVVGLLLDAAVVVALSQGIRNSEPFYPYGAPGTGH